MFKDIKYVNIPGSNFHQRKSNRLLKRYKPVLVITAIVVFAAILHALFSGPASVFDFNFANILKPKDDPIHVLLLGNAGGTHDGAYLTDTVMMASYNPKTKQAYFISLPRDLWLEDKKIKLNAVYETAGDHNGLKYSKDVIGGILGVPIDYAIRIDFRGFTQAVDEVGGLDIEVDRSFDDTLYPIDGKETDLCGFEEQEKDFSEDEAKSLNIDPGKRKVLISPDGKIATDSADPNKGYQYFACRYEKISFTKGLTHMDGETALKYVRSRMGSNGEGSDFARSKRQQKVIDAFRKKVLSLETLANPKKIAGLINAWGISFETDIPIDQMIPLYNLTKKIEGSHNFVISSYGQDALLENPPLSDYGGAWVLVPKDRSFGNVKIWVAKVLSGGLNNEATSSARPSNSSL